MSEFKLCCPKCFDADTQPVERFPDGTILIRKNKYHLNPFVFSNYLTVAYQWISSYGKDDREWAHCNHCGFTFETSEAVELREIQPVEPGVHQACVKKLA